MREKRILWVLFLMLGSGLARGQEEGSADLFTESYTDQFQEAFFEALKQKGIENYDRSVALMLEAKKFNPDNPVVDFELARILILAKKYNRAEPFALEALLADPSEYWYVDTYMQALSAQSKRLENYTSQLPVDQPEFRLNLARWYVSEGSYSKARAQLSTLKDLEEASWLKQEIDRLEAMGDPAPAKGKPEDARASEDGRSVASFESRLSAFLESEDWVLLEKESTVAIESYPLQPQFYYYRGLSLLRQDRKKEALAALKEGEGLLLEPSETARQIYGALSETYTALGDTENSKRYKDKQKTGL